MLDPPSLLTYTNGDDQQSVLAWRLSSPALAIASTPLGGGVGPCEWVLNVQVDEHYARTDLEDHLHTIAAELGCAGVGVGFLTAADVSRLVHGHDGDVDAFATVGLRLPTWAADADAAVSPVTIGTINIVVGVPQRLADAALVNAVITATEAKVQALSEAGVPGTGTASDAVCIVCPSDGDAEPFAGPRSPIGARIARAVHQAVAHGTRTWRELENS
jgi:adenosylcobinamide amidohydrolase